MPTRDRAVGEASWKVSSTPVPSPAIRQQVSARPSSMLAATYVVRLPKASSFGGAVAGAVAVADEATSTGSPAGTVSDGGGADELGSSAAVEGGGAGSS